MDYAEKALELHKKDNNCAQCVLLALSDYTGLSDGQAAAIAAGFGGGMRTGEVCGAVTGALMAMGLAEARDGNGAKDAPAAKYAKELQKRFKADYGTERCAALIKAAKGRKRCEEFISYCARLAAALIEDESFPPEEKAPEDKSAQENIITEDKNIQGEEPKNADI